MEDLTFVLTIEAKEDETIEGVQPHQPTAAEVTPLLESLLTDHTKHEAAIGWRVIAVRPEPGPGPEPEPEPVPGPLPAKPGFMTPEQRARWGNFQPDWWPSLRGDFPEQLLAGPPAGRGMRLVALPGRRPGGMAMHEAKTWVRAHVPGAGEILSVKDAGVTPEGAPAYLVTYELVQP